MCVPTGTVRALGWAFTVGATHLPPQGTVNLPPHHRPLCLPPDTVPGGSGIFPITFLPATLQLGPQAARSLAVEAERAAPVGTGAQQVPTSVVRGGEPSLEHLTWRPHWALNEHGSPPGPPESPAPREDKKKKRDEDSTGGGGALTPKRNKAKTA